MIMLRKSLWFSLTFVIMAVLAFASVSAKPKKKRRPERISNPPTLSLTADPTVVKVCADETSRIRLTATARSADGGPLRYRWTTNRSEEHTSELQSQSNLVCRLLLE